MPVMPRAARWRASAAATAAGLAAAGPGAGGNGAGGCICSSPVGVAGGPGCAWGGASAVRLDVADHRVGVAAFGVQPGIRVIVGDTPYAGWVGPGRPAGIAPGGFP